MHEQSQTVESQHRYGIACVFTRPTRDISASAGVLLLHGFGSGKDNKLNRELAPRLTSVGIATCRFDFAGHGESGGSTGSLTIRRAAQDLTKIAGYFRQEFLLPRAKLGIVASSFGASAALRALKHLSPVSALFLRAPISDYAEVRRLQYGDEGISRWRKTGFIEVESSKGPQQSGFEFYKDARSHDTYKEIRNLKTPTLILHGDRDDNVPLEQSRKLAKAVGAQARLVVVNGAGHGFSDSAHQEQLVTEAMSFLSAHLSGG